MADRDGLGLVEEEAVLRFGRDHRMREVCRVLRSSRPVFLKVSLFYSSLPPPLSCSLPSLIAPLPPSLPPSLLSSSGRPSR